MKLKFRKRQKKINITMCFLIFTNDIKMLLYRISVCLYVIIERMTLIVA